MTFWEASTSPPDGETAALVVQDHTTKWFGRHPATSKSANVTMMGLMHFAGPDDKVSRLHTDRSGALSLVARNLLWIHAVKSSHSPRRLEGFSRAWRRKKMVEVSDEPIAPSSDVALE